MTKIVNLIQLCCYGLSFLIVLKSAYFNYKMRQPLWFIMGTFLFRSTGLLVLVLHPYQFEYIFIFLACETMCHCINRLRSIEYDKKSVVLMKKMLSDLKEREFMKDKRELITQELNCLFNRKNINAKELSKRIYAFVNEKSLNFENIKCEHISSLLCITDTERAIVIRITKENEYKCIFEGLLEDADDELGLYEDVEQTIQLLKKGRPFADKLKGNRKIHLISKTKLANTLNISRDIITKIENKEIEPGLILKCRLKNSVCNLGDGAWY